MRVLPWVLVVGLVAAGGTSAPDGARSHDARGDVHPDASTRAADTVVAVQAGDRIHIENRNGHVTVEGTTGSSLEVFDEGRRSGMAVERRGSRLDIVARDRNRDAHRVIRIRVPRNTPVEIDGHALEVEARGLEAGLRVSVIEGDVSGFDLAAGAELRTIDGDVVAERIRGGLVAATVDGSVRVAEVRGRVSAESMDGELVLDDVDGDEIVATTVDGDIYFSGPVAAGSRVRLVTHDGDVTAFVPVSVSADVEVSTFEGEFLPGFPVRVGRVQAGQPLRFRLGDGAARLEVQVFDGDIQLRHRPGR